MTAGFHGGHRQPCFFLFAATRDCWSTHALIVAGHQRGPRPMITSGAGSLPADFIRSTSRWEHEKIVARSSMTSIGSIAGIGLAVSSGLTGVSQHAGSACHCQGGGGQSESLPLRTVVIERIGFDQDRFDHRSYVSVYGGIPRATINPRGAVACGCRCLSVRFRFVICDREKYSVDEPRTCFGARVALWTTGTLRHDHPRLQPLDQVDSHRSCNVLGFVWSCGPSTPPDSTSRGLTAWMIP